MYVEGGWKPPWEPPSRKPRLTDKQERTLLWLLLLNAITLLIAPIGGVTLVEALMAMFRSVQH